MTSSSVLNLCLSDSSFLQFQSSGSFCSVFPKVYRSDKRCYNLSSTLTTNFHFFKMPHLQAIKILPLTMIRTEERDQLLKDHPSKLECATGEQKSRWKTNKESLDLRTFLLTLCQVPGPDAAYNKQQLVQLGQGCIDGRVEQEIPEHW